MTESAVMPDCPRCGKPVDSTAPYHGFLASLQAYGCLDCGHLLVRGDGQWQRQEIECLQCGAIGHVAFDEDKDPVHSLCGHSAYAHNIVKSLWILRPVGSPR